MLTSFIMMQLKFPCWKGVNAGFFFPNRPASSMFIVFNSDTSSRVSSVFSAQSVGTYLKKYDTEVRLSTMVITAALYVPLLYQWKGL